ncbi:MAG: ribonuclease H-like domain-containing protein [Patescibacteria group bacterium]|nr:ribonuclease H-like domain-containing protein [Patescibacteria group bacterium]
MRKFPLVLDLETKYTFRQFSDPKKLEVTVAAIFDYRDNQTKVFLEDELNKLFPLLESSSYIIGFNVKEFDLPVLQRYYPGEVSHFAAFDILEDIRTKIGKRLALNDILQATLEKKKTGHGLMAIDFYKEGKMDELKKYCIGDVILTKEVFDFGVKNGRIYYLTSKGKEEIKVNWKKYLEEDSPNNNIPLTLPF